jgi:4'-phosphopantetheinyl transferase
MDLGWSHSGEVLVLALGESVELGIDVERIRNRPRLGELAQRFFHADEFCWLQAQAEESRIDAFVRLWCAKEAVLKAHGQGLSFGLHKLVFAPVDGVLRMTRCDAALGSPADWNLHEWVPLEGYRAALAWRRR